MNFRNLLAKHYINLRGWKTNRKIVVIESDDWGSIRMPSQETVELLKQKYPLKNNLFTLLDGLERKDDLRNLFNLLETYADKNGNHPVLTACSVVANPDFERIQQSDFQNYNYETIDKTYRDYGEDKLLNLWIEKGIKENLLYPQFHGREHLNPNKWLAVLNSENQMEQEAFSKKILLGLTGGETDNEKLYMAAFEATDDNNKGSIENITKEGLDLFEKLFGFRSISYIPSQSKQFEEINDSLVKAGVKFSQAGQYFVPQQDDTFKKVDKLWGNKDQYGMTYWRRNCSFEPYKEKEDTVENCLKEIDIAFRCGKPAVISSHRINYTSRIDVDHRNKSLDQLNILLSKLLKKHPDIEFINSEQLGKLMLKSQN